MSRVVIISVVSVETARASRQSSCVVPFVKWSRRGELRFSASTSITETTSCACPGLENRSLAIRGFLPTRPVLVRPPFRVFRSKERVPESARRKLRRRVIRARKFGLCCRRRKYHGHMCTRVLALRQLRVICVTLKMMGIRRKRREGWFRMGWLTSRRTALFREQNVQGNSFRVSSRRRIVVRSNLKRTLQAWIELASRPRSCDLLIHG